MRKIIFSCFCNFKREFYDSLPFFIRKERNIPNIIQSLKEIHFPSSFSQLEQARQRFIFEELFFSQILVYLRKAKHRLQKGVALKIRKEVSERIKENLPFKLTSSQEEVFSQIVSDLAKPYPMHRLLQGDVGSGKTIVAALAAGICIDCLWQVAFMVPTEVLALQHKETLRRIFKGIKLSSLSKSVQAKKNESQKVKEINIEVLTSSLSDKKRSKIYRELKEGKIDIIVGTHSLIQEKVEFKRLGLVVIDEQHKFGVAQRALLPQKGKINPHYLVMSATPIPRSLALSLYGDLDCSVIRELPPGRIPPQTIWVKEEERSWVYEFLKSKLKEKRQIYIIYPVIEESEEMDLKSMGEMYEKIQQEFSSFCVEMFHGRLKGDKKQKIIRDFKEKRIDILVSTTVVEVGLDIENATVMVVENPQRFGLAQLHQLRGRIQRSNYQPYFILISNSKLSEIALKRLQVISQINDGFRIAEEDLKMRGPGDFFGHLQHGIPKLKIASPLKDLEILKQARSFAYRVIKNDPYLEKPEHRSIRQELDFWFK